DYIDYVSEDSGTDTWETDPSLTDQYKKETLLVRKNSLDAKLEKLRFRALIQHQNRYRAAIQADNVKQNIDNDLSDDDLLANSIQDSESECDDLFDVPPARKRAFDETQEKTAKNTKHNELAKDVKNVYTTPKLNKNKTPDYNTPKTLQAPKYVQSLASTSPALHPAISAYLLPIFPQVAVMKPVYQPAPQFMNGTYTALNKKLVLLINNDLWRAQNDIPRVRVFPPEKRQPATTSSDEIDLIELEISDDEEAVIRV
uniref:Uncharacterized protein n=1 Tax=Ciona savignyi TaxID=51511 RepID=H2Z1H5_CIOSA